MHRCIILDYHVHRGAQFFPNLIFKIAFLFPRKCTNWLKDSLQRYTRLQKSVTQNSRNLFYLRSTLLSLKAQSSSTLGQPVAFHRRSARAYAHFAEKRARAFLGSQLATKLRACTRARIHARMKPPLLSSRLSVLKLRAKSFISVFVVLISVLYVIKTEFLILHFSMK